MSNQDVEAPPAEAAKMTASGGGKAAAMPLLLVAVPALIVGSVALSRINAASTLQSQQTVDLSTAQKSGEESTLDNVVSAGILKCGVIPVVGFAENSDGAWVGMDTDLCRAVAAGVGVGVEFVETTFSDRWTDLQSGRFDLLSAYSTHTMERDVYQDSAGDGFCFSEPYFYDGTTCELHIYCVACLGVLLRTTISNHALFFNSSGISFRCWPSRGCSLP